MSLEIQPEIDKVWFNLGVELLNKKCFEEALEAFEQANELKSGNYQVWVNHSWALLNLGRNLSRRLHHFLW